MSAAPNLELQRERFRKQMSRAQLARMTNLPPKTLISVEERKARVRFGTAQRIAAALEVDINDLFRCDEVIG